MTRRSLGGRQIVWGAALSALLAIAGHQVWAHARVVDPQQTGQTTQPPATTASPTMRGGRPGGPPNGRFGGGPHCGDSPDSSSWEWWNDDRAKKEMGLSAEQAKQIDSYYTRRMKDIDPFVQEYQKERAALDQLFNQRTGDDTALLVQLNRVSGLRNQIASSRLLMLYHMAKVLSPDQFTKLKAIYDRHTQDVCGGRGGGGAERPDAAALPR